jgi:hypothetical protein
MTIPSYSVLPEILSNIGLLRRRRLLSYKGVASTQSHDLVNQCHTMAGASCDAVARIERALLVQRPSLGNLRPLTRT